MDHNTFLANLQASRLLNTCQYDAILEQLSPAATVRSLAQTLVRDRLLTQFQAGMILAGRTEGFCIGHYRILEPIGSGAYGRVYKAVHIPLNRIVAIKLLASRLAKEAASRALFMREIRSLACLNHPNIIAALDAGDVNGRCFLVMEYVAGMNLASLVQQRGALPIDRACDFIRQAALGLQCAHEHGLVHRDVKPSNLLVGMHGTDGPRAGPLVKVLDFGLAQLHVPEPRRAAENIFLGTPDFMSPEQARNPDRVDIRSDLYGLGCCLYYLLAGRVPFPGGTTREKLARHALEQPTPIWRLRSTIPGKLVTLVSCLMAKEPRRRLPTPRELAHALSAFCASHLV